MLPQFYLADCTFGAERTEELELLCVLCDDVVLEVGRYAERLAAVRTHVRFFACVRANVQSQNAQRVEPAAAVGASESLSVSVPVQPVSGQAALVLEANAADVTAVSPRVVSAPPAA